MRTVLAVALLALVVSAGCIGTPRVSEEPPDWVTTDADSATTETPTTATDTEATTTEAPAETTATAIADTPAATDAEPRKGDQFLSVSRLNESQAMQWNASKRASFGSLSEERQQVVKEALQCDCNVELDGEFSFHDKARVEVVKYEGTYYFLRVSIV